VSEPLADQLDAAFRAAEGYSSLASSFHPELRKRVSALVHQAQGFPYPNIYAELLPFHHELHERAVQAATDSPAPYLVWAMHPKVNWPVPMGYSPEDIAGVLLDRCWVERCNWCGRDDTEPTDALLVSAGCAIALFSFCTFCRTALDHECQADLAWL
jgi:hypothetical protein